MKRRISSICIIVLSNLVLILSTVQMSASVLAVSPLLKTLTGYIPAAVTSGEAHPIGPHSGADRLALTIGLPLRNEQALTQFLKEASTPYNPHYRHYLTQAEANQAFNPTPQQEQQVISWLKSQGLTVTHTYSNHLLVDTTGTVSQVEQLFHVTINDYTIKLDGKQITFYAPANDPTVDGPVSSVIDSILGLDDYPSFHVDASFAQTRPTNNGNADGSPPYYPQDFANAYDVNPLWNVGDTGVGQNIGIVLWAPPPSSATLQQFDAQTGAQPPNLQTIPVDGGSIYPVSTDVAEEAGMDVEYTSGMAPGATIDYYEAPDTQQGGPTNSGLDDALNMAGSDANNNAQISSSWGGCEAKNISDPFTMQTEQILQSNTATGHDYLFSSGDNGSACVPDPNNPCSYKDPYPQYPASSAYATSVGGTTFNGNINGGYPGEVTWIYTPSTCPNPMTSPEGSGGGYSKLFAQPGWQAGFSKNKHRGYPDIAADADPNTGAFVCYDTDNGPICSVKGSPSTYIGGTSLATPLWAGMVADVNQYMQSQNDQPLGFINPLLYTIFNGNGSPYIAYHDIKKGTNGHYKAGPGWDAVTGLGSPDLNNLALDAVYLENPFQGELFGITAISAKDIWAVGYYIASSGYKSTLIEQWNGNSWNVVPSPNPGLYDDYLFSVTAISANDVWAVGEYDGSNEYQSTLIEQWNGSSWNVVPSPNSGSYDNELSSVAVISANDVWAVGYYNDSNGNSLTLIEQWNGSTWNVIPSPNSGSNGNELSGVAVVSANDVWAVGSYYNSNSNLDTLIEQWNGSSWNVVPSPSPGLYGNSLRSVAVVSANDIWAVGGYNNGAGGYNGYTLIEQWNGSNWNVVSGPNPPVSYINDVLASVAVVSTNDVWAVGSYLHDYGNFSTLIGQWNGSSWNVVSSSNANPYYDILWGATAVSAKNVWAVGYYVAYDNAYTLIEQWNGSSWNIVPSPNISVPGKR